MIFHGTGSGNPSISRSASSLSIGDADRHRLLIDCGEGTARRLRADDISYHEVDAIILSHWHADHWTGLPGLLTGMKIASRTAPLTLHVPIPSARRFQAILETTYLFVESLGFELTVKEYGSGDIIRWRSLEIHPFATSHLEKHRERACSLGLPETAYGFLMRGNGRRILLSQDVGSIDDVVPYLPGCELLVCESTHIEHDEAVRIANEHDVDHVIFTHVGDDDHEKLRRLLRTNTDNRSRVTVAIDGLSIQL